MIEDKKLIMFCLYIAPKTWSHGNRDSPTLISDLTNPRSKKHQKTRSCFNGLVVSTKERTSTREKIHSASGPRSSSTTEHGRTFRLSSYAHSEETVGTLSRLDHIMTHLRSRNWHSLSRHTYYILTTIITHVRRNSLYRWGKRVIQTKEHGI